jgi:hypothetical protein
VKETGQNKLDMVDLFAEEEKTQVHNLFNQEPMITVSKAFVLNKEPGESLGHQTPSQLQKLSGNLRDFLVVPEVLDEVVEEKIDDTMVTTEKHSRNDASGVEVGDMANQRFQGLVKHKEKSSKSVTYNISDASVSDSGADTANKSGLDAHRPSSALLRARRKQHEQRETHLRGLINTVSASFSGDEHSVSSACTYNTVETSLLSHGLNLSKGKNIKWENVNVYISFGLLTALGEAPKQGIYESMEDMKQNTILTSIMSKMKTLSKAMIEQNTGNILMKCQEPFVTSIQRDGEF